MEIKNDLAPAGKSIMTQESEVNQLAQAVEAVQVNEVEKVKKTRPAKAEKPAKQPPPPPPEDHAKDRYGKVPVNFGRISHSGKDALFSRIHTNQK